MRASSSHCLGPGLGAAPPALRAMAPLWALWLWGCAHHSRIPPEGRVWVADDGERIGRWDGELPLSRGEDNAVWTPGQPVRLVALPGETVAFQVVVSAGNTALRGVTVELGALRGPGGAVLQDAAAPATAGLARSATAPPRWRTIERFVTHDLQVQRRSGGKTRGESLGWSAGAMPPDKGQLGWLPDPLIPVELAPPYADYPMTVNSGENRVVWIDVTVPQGGENGGGVAGGENPGGDLPPGSYSGMVSVRVAGQDRARLVELPIELVVGPAPLPYPAARTMVYYDPAEITGRIGDPAAVRYYLQLMHRHGLSTVYRVNTAAEVAAQRDELTGALFTRDQGYSGPGEGRGADVISIGTYGSLGPPTPESIEQVHQVLAALRALGPPLLPQRRDVFLYAVDEQCTSPLSRQWRDALAQQAEASSLSAPPQVPASAIAPQASTLQPEQKLTQTQATTQTTTLTPMAKPMDKPTVKIDGVRIGHTCSQDPKAQQVGLAIVAAGSYDPTRAAAARQQGKQVWIYNGNLPQTGSFLLDGGALSLVANGWIQARYGIDRWFYWESTFWNDDNRGGHGPYDPLAQAETFHNRQGDHANGDGVLVYPGTQLGYPAHSLGMAGVLPSIRLKQWRRGLSDAGYYQLAHAIDPAQAERIAADLVPQALAGSDPRSATSPTASPLSLIGRGSGASWPARGAPYYQARRQLFDIILRGAPPRAHL